MTDHVRPDVSAETLPLRGLDDVFSALTGHLWAGARNDHRPPPLPAPGPAAVTEGPPGPGGRPAIQGGPVDQVGDVRAVTLGNGPALTLGPLAAEHVDQLWLLFADAVARGEGYPQTPPLTRDTFEQVWLRPVTVTVGAVRSGRLVGAYYMKPNLPGLGAHIANAGYLVDRAARGGGIGRRLVEDSIERAPLAGFDAVQFNFVFEANPARAMYEALGWREVGRIPGAVPTPGGGHQDALIYWRAVGPAASDD